MEFIFIVVKNDYLPKLPLAVQLFIKEYFHKRGYDGRENKIFGIECMTATCSDDWGSGADFSSRGDTLTKTGLPCGVHYIAMSGYKGDLDLEKYPFGAVSWLLTEAGNNQLEGVYFERIRVFND